jgi:hypothetical protein
VRMLGRGNHLLDYELSNLYLCSSNVYLVLEPLPTSYLENSSLGVPVMGQVCFTTPASHLSQC